MEDLLGGINVAVLVTDGFEQIELTSPCSALQEAGASTVIISVTKGRVQGFHHEQKADSFAVAQTFEDADPQDFDAVLLPGGVMNGDRIRMAQHAREFVRAMQAAGKPIAAICHGGWLLVSAGLVKGRTLTSWPSLQDDIRNAGGHWVDQQVAVDQNLISSRKPGDIPAFNQQLVEMLCARVKHSARGTADAQRAGLSS